MSGRFSGKVAVVTGASRGIGLAIAARLVGEGAKVVITARSAEGLQRAAQSLGPGAAIGVAGPADDAVHQADTVSTAIEAFGRVDFLVNNTGINPAYGRMVDADLSVAEKIFSVNVLSALAWSQAVYRAWMADNGGAIVNVASAAGLRPAANIGIYGASKAALLHLTAQLAAELAPGVRVNAVAPAVVKTKFAAALYEGQEQHVATGYPLQRLGIPEDVAGAVSFLLSDDAAWVTGLALAVDGGLMLTGGV
jgi:3-oxoacyl-[acyl-carrier protein] reductase